MTYNKRKQFSTADRIFAHLPNKGLFQKKQQNGFGLTTVSFLLNQTLKIFLKPTQSYEDTSFPGPSWPTLSHLGKQECFQKNH